MNRKVSDPVDSCRLGVAVVIDVIDMTLFRACQHNATFIPPFHS